MEEERAVWDNRFSFLMAMIGSAVGLGNIWRFPKVLYANGGGSFLIPYVVALAILGFSFVILEYGVGFSFRASAPKIFRQIKEKSEIIAWIILFTLFLLLTYYLCIIGWDLIYLVLSFTKGWGANPDLFFTQSILHAAPDISGILSIVPLLAISVILIWFSIWAINKADINKGISKVCNVLIPILAILIAVIVIFSLNLPGASIGLTKMFTPNWSALTDLNIWLAAFGQIVFSLSLGFGTALAYASYLPEDSKIVNNGLIVACSNSAFEVFNAVGVFSILGFMALTTSIPFDKLVTEGSGLAFVVFPQVLNLMGIWAYIIGPIFFLCILFAGITSAISMVEPISIGLTEKFDINRKKATTLICLLGFIISLAFTTQSGTYILDIFDGFLNNFVILFLIAIECILFAWIYKADDIIKVINKTSDVHVGKIWKIMVKFVVPACILVLWANGVYTQLRVSDFASQIIMILILIFIIVIPVVLTKLPAKNKNFYEDTKIKIEE